MLNAPAFSIDLPHGFPAPFLSSTSRARRALPLRAHLYDLPVVCVSSPMPNAKMLELLQHLRASRFRELAGAHAAAAVPVSEALLNQLIAASLPLHAPVRSVTVLPESGNHLSVRIVPKVGLLPAITLKLAIEQQPQLPANGLLVLRMVTLGGLFGLASGAVGGLLPPGVQLQGDRILVDLRRIAAERGFS